MPLRARAPGCDGSCTETMSSHIWPFHGAWGDVLDPLHCGLYGSSQIISTGDIVRIWWRLEKGHFVCLPLPLSY
jgi:hypothetical protein